MTVERMLYRRYKTSFSDCEIVPCTYDKATKTIEVKIPEGRMKKSGVRGKCFHWMYFDGVEIVTGKKVQVCVKAIDKDHAIKQLENNYSDCKFDY